MHTAGLRLSRYDSDQPASRLDQHFRKKQRQVVYISQDGKKIPAHESKRYQVAPQPQVLKRSVTDSNVAAKAWDSPSHLSQAVKGGASKHDATWEVPAEHVVLFGDVYDLNEHFGDAEH